MRLTPTILVLVLFIALGATLSNGCSKHPGAEQGAPINFVVPPGFPQPLQIWASSPLTEEAFVLGRKLFFDGRLSKDGNFPCSSCHQPVAAYTTFEHDRSHGYNQSHTLRNAPGLHNLAWSPDLNQDGSGRSLEAIARAHITHPQEMGETIPAVLDKLRADTAYRRLFKAAYGTETITDQGMLNALAQYVLNLVSANSKYDKVKRGEAQFIPEEAAGYAVFQSRCASCHTEPLFTDFSYRNIGLPVDPQLNDYGRMRVTRRPEDSLKFRVPSLRNVALTSYYFHDGRASMPAVVVEHYRKGVIQSPTLDPSLANGIQMTNTEAFNLVQFLYTLTDSSFLNNPRFRE
jgi:cytochrome c peroxidase